MAIRRTTEIVLVLGVLASLASCTTLTMCPEFGWVNTVSVELSGATDSFELVRLCVNETCAASPPNSEIGRSAGGERIGVHGSETSPGTWTVMWTDPEFADSVVVQALGADGEVLAESEMTLEFVRTSGTEECGGPSSAEVDLAIPD
jgi:hypothetical protein